MQACSHASARAKPFGASRAPLRRAARAAPTLGRRPLLSIAWPHPPRVRVMFLILAACFRASDGVDAVSWRQNLDEICSSQNRR